MPHPDSNLDVSVSETGDYQRTDQGPADDTITMNRDEGPSVHDSATPPETRDASKRSSTNLPLPELRKQINRPPPEEPTGMPTWAKAAIAGALVMGMLLVGGIAVGAAVYATSGDDGAPSQDEVDEKRRQAEEAIGVPVRDGLSNKKKRDK